MVSVCWSLPETSNPMMLLREDNLPGCWKTWCDFVKWTSRDKTAQIITSCPNKKCVGIVFKMSLSLFLQYHCLQTGLEFWFLNNFFSWKHKWGCGRSHIHLLVTMFLVLGYYVLMEKAESLLCLSDVGKTKYFERLRAAFTWPKF